VAEKPKASPHDVFAKQDVALVRGTPIEDLQPTAEKTAVSDERGVNPVTTLAGEPPSSAPPGMGHGSSGHTQIPSAAPTGHSWSNRSGTSALVVASIALVVSLTAPFWEDTVLSSIGIRTPAVGSAELDAAALARQDARLAGFEQRLVAATAQVDAMNGALAMATRRRVARVQPVRR
jgi:hypothetical protein